MSLNGLFVLIKPVLFTCINNVFGSFLLEDFNLLLSSDNIKQGNVLFLTVFVEHSSQGGGCSCINHTLGGGTSIAPFFVGVNKSNDCNGVDDSGSC
jgi:hypothetical protein